MPVKLLIVDDSAVVRGLISKVLSAEAGIEIVGTAANGEVAVEMAAALCPDIVILDIQMPVRDGLAALPEILKAVPACKVIISSTLTQQSAAAGYRALELGAADYIGKPSTQFGEDANAFFDELLRKVRALGGITPTMALAAPVLRSISAQDIGALALISSTGGPQALISIFTQMQARLQRIPVFITQHMPPNFTRTLAGHLSDASGQPCAEAVDGEAVMPGHIYVAPGDFHMQAVRGSGGEVTIKLTQDAPENFCRPSADPMLRSLSDVYGAHLLVAVLTGMGHDGLQGCTQVVEKGGRAIAQDQATSVVYGMPRVVAEHGLCSAVLPLPQMGRYILQAIGEAV